MPQPSKEKTVSKTEFERVLEHRKSFFGEVLGASHPAIEDLAKALHASPHEARQLKSNGCPIDLIPKILV